MPQIPVSTRAFLMAFTFFPSAFPSSWESHTEVRSVVISDGSGGVTTAAMMLASRRDFDFNLNHPPQAAYEDPAREALKQTMIQHEIVFNNQLQELHRLYWAQKNLMNELCWRRPDLVLEARDVRSRLPTIQTRNFDLELAADEFIGDTTEELSHEFEVGNISDCNVLGASHMKLDLNAREAVDSALEDNSALRKIPNESLHTLTQKYSHTENDVDGWQNQSHSNAGCREHGSSLSTNSPYEEEQMKTKLVQIDLNIAQEEEPVDQDNVEAYPSPSTSSSIVLRGDNLRVSRRNRDENESNVTAQHDVISLVLENSRKMCAGSLISKPRDSYHPPVQASGQSSQSIDKMWVFNEYAEDGEHWNNAGETILVDVDKSVDENIVSAVSQPNSPHRSSGKNSSISSSCIEHNCLLASAGSTNLPPSTAGGVEGKQVHIERSEEDTVSSHAVAPNHKQPDELKKSPDGIMLNHIIGDGECTSKEKFVAKHATADNSETTHSGPVTPERICGKRVQNAESNSSHNFHSSQPKEDWELARVDTCIRKAAETLVSISSDNPLDFLHRRTTNRRMEFDLDEGDHHPQCSDSFEALALNLEDIRDNGSSACDSQIDNKIVGDVPGIKLRRGSRLRDFQKDILPGIISLSRHEICEDLYAIKYELRKKRPRRVGKQNLAAPVRSRRSRLYTAGKRR